mgnify:CR=1 FL=1
MVKNGVHKYLLIINGRYDTIEEAIEARKKAAKEYYGEFANED